MLHEILLSLWGCSTSVSQMIETDVSVYCNNRHNNILVIIEMNIIFLYTLLIFFIVYRS